MQLSYYDGKIEQFVERLNSSVKVWCNNSFVKVQCKLNSSRKVVCTALTQCDGSVDRLQESLTRCLLCTTRLVFLIVMASLNSSLKTCVVRTLPGKPWLQLLHVVKAVLTSCRKVVCCFCTTPCTLCDGLTELCPSSRKVLCAAFVQLRALFVMARLNSVPVPGSLVCCFCTRRWLP